jgi:3-hydroxyacyl-[acyl-carrier-protein] dehydratase
MRWMWIDRILELERGRRCVAIKNISLAEEHLHDHFPGTPVMPASLIIEGMAQTAGILVGHARDFREKVILAKIGKAVLDCDALPGSTLFYTAVLDRIDDTGASAQGTVELLDHCGGERQTIGAVDLMFSHIDQNRRGLEFPEHNFVFTDQFFDLLRNSGIS